MPKVTLSFNLPEDLEEYTTTMNASKLYNILFEFDQYLRAINKYGNPQYQEDVLQLVTEQNYTTADACAKILRTKLNELIQLNGIDL